MINIEDLTSEDVGRTVIYTQQSSDTIEEGVIANAKKKRKDIIVIITSAFLIYVFTASLWTYLSVLITIICAMISTHKFDIGIKEIDKISILNYILVIIIFLIIGITK